MGKLTHIWKSVCLRQSCATLQTGYLGGWEGRRWFVRGKLCVWGLCVCPGIDCLLPAWVSWHCCLAGVWALRVSSRERQHFFGTAVKFCIITDFKVTSVGFSFQELNIFALLPRESVWGIVCLRLSALFSSFHHPPAAVVPFQVSHARVSSLLLCNAWPCFARECGAWLPGAGGVHQSGGRLQTCPVVLVPLFDWLLSFLHHPLLWRALRTNCGNVLLRGLWTVLWVETIRQE